jgi:hypothetical protein
VTPVHAGGGRVASAVREAREWKNGISIMIRIRYSDAMNRETELEGSNAELAYLRDEIKKFANGDEALICIPTESAFDPTPYQIAVVGLLIRKAPGKLTFDVSDDQLVIAGTPASLYVFADNLPWDAMHTSDVNYHVHFDRIGREDYVAEGTNDIVLALKR